MKTPHPLPRLFSILLAAMLLSGLTLHAVPVQPAQADGFSLFEPPVFYSASSAASDFALGDINLDGSLDIVSTDHLERRLGIFINQGDGTFTSSFMDGLGEWVIAIQLHDMDGDGYLDVVVADASIDAVVILSNVGSGTFSAQPPNILYVGDFPNDIVVADFNRDGKPDIAAANLHGETVSILLNAGNGSFLPQVQYTTGLNPAFLAVDDFNQDGKLDLAATNAGSTTVSVLLGKGDGTFQAKTDFGVGSAPSAVIAEDFNNDGSTDLAVANSLSDTVSILPGYNDGTFGPKVDFAVGVKPYGMTAGDFNGDGKIDLVTASFETDNLTLLLNQGGGVFAPAVYYPAGGTSSTVRSADLNNDGKLDLVTENANGAIAVLMNAGPDCGQGGLISQGVFETGAYPHYILSEDFNGDGKIDLATSNYFGGNVSVLMNAGGGDFFPKADFSVGGGAYNLVTDDFNRDGMPDIVVGKDQSIAVLLNDGNGSFYPPVFYETNFGSPYSITSGDFNDDGKVDLAAYDGRTRSVFVMQNDGSGAFAIVSTRVLEESMVEAIKAGDFNLDGKTDLVVQSWDQVSLLINDGSGNFISKSSFQAHQDIQSIELGDFNNDGNLDVVVSYPSGIISIFESNGVGGFFPRVDIEVDPEGEYIYTLIVSDYNLDGKVDLAFLHWGKSSAHFKLMVLLNDGKGSFQPQFQIDLDWPFVPAAAAADFNGDGVPDFALVNTDPDNNGVLIFHNHIMDMQGLEIQSLNSGSWENSATWTCRVPTAVDSVHINSGHFVQLHTDALVNNLTIDGELTVSYSPRLTIGEDWANNGSFFPSTSTVAFEGSGDQNIFGNTTFHNVFVGSQATLATFSEVTVTGTLTNQGWTSETKSISGKGLVKFGLADVQTNITSQGTLTSMQVKRRDTDHPNGPTGQQIGPYWSIATNQDASGFTTSLTLPTRFAPTSQDKVCRYTGSTWDCAQTSSTNSSITRSGITQFSDWTVLRSFTTNTTVTSNLNPSIYGQQVTLKAAVTSSGGIPTGMVTFYDGSTLLGSQTLDAAGEATLKTSALTAGTHAITARYSGEGGFPSSSGSYHGGQVVAPAQITITAHKASRVYGSANPTFTYSISGLVNGETPIVLGGSPSLTTSADKSSPVGEYAITGEKGSIVNDNYSYTFVDGKLTIIPATLTLKAGTYTWSPGSPFPALGFTITGFVNSENDHVLIGFPIIDSKATQYSRAGSYPIVISQGSLSADNYTFAFVNGTFTIQKHEIFLPIIW